MKIPRYLDAIFRRTIFAKRFVFWGSVSMIAFAVLVGVFYIFQRLYTDRGTGPTPGDPAVSDLSKYYPEVPEEPTIDDGEPFVIVGVGDISLGRGVKRAINEGVDPFASVRDTVSAADLAIANLECAITDNPARTGGKGVWGGIIYLGGDLTSSHLVGGAGFDYVSLANNHVMDYGNDGLRDTMDALDFAGIAYSGAGVNSDEAYRPAIFREGGYNVALFSFCFVEPRGYAAGEDKWGIAWFKKNRAKTAIAEYVTSADLVIVSMHWGIEGETEPVFGQRNAARELIDAGADIILGHHNHRLGPVETYNGGIIAYSLGNFVFDTMYPKRRVTTILTIFANRESGLLGYSLTPYQIDGVSPKPVESDNPEMVYVVP
ncbi:MAG: CapA family protein [bacterium]|nr:CapA family protein [bacterium]